MPLLVDTGVLYALADRSDAWHTRVRRFVRAEPEPLLAPVTILPEVTHLLYTRLGPRAERLFVRSLVEREIDVEELRHGDMSRVLELLDKYPDIGFVDASVVAAAERLKLRRLATTDRRHFGLIRPNHVERLELVP